MISRHARNIPQCVLRHVSKNKQTTEEVSVSVSFCSQTYRSPGVRTLNHPTLNHATVNHRHLITRTVNHATDNHATFKHLDISSRDISSRIATVTARNWSPYGIPYMNIGKIKNMQIHIYTQ